MTFNLANIPVLETERLVMREWRESDFDLVHGIYSHEENSRYVGGLFNRSQSWRYMASHVGHWQFRGFGMWVVERKSDGTAIGYSGLWCPEGWPEPEVGYILHRDFHGQGYASEVARRGLQFAYEDLGWTTAISLIAADNHASKNVARKLGGHLEANTVIFDGKAEIWRHLPASEFLGASNE
ncbi:MAG: GNAT family N-acetyltransferase [Pseudomonadota bacterium]